MKKKILTSIKILGGLSIALIAFSTKLRIAKYKIYTSKFKKGNKIKIVLISDLHSFIYKNEQDELINIIKSQKPDIIALTGDIVDDIIPIKGSKLFLEKIKDIAKIYYVSGNHEFRTRKIKEIKELFTKNNVMVLEHSFKKINIKNEKILIAGVDDPAISIYQNKNFNWKKQMYDEFKCLEKLNSYNVLLTHRPEHIEMYKKISFDLILSGHAHGGLIRIPIILNGFYAGNQGFFPKYAGGIYRYDKLNHIISRGLSKKFYQPRVFNRPEVVSIEIMGK